MGDVIHIAAFDPLHGKELPKRRPEPAGYLLCPARILEPLAKLEASVNAMAADHGNTGKGICWDSYFRVVAILEFSTRYQ